ncbi:MAG: methyltransferase domain-containing protein [Chitinophagaceae bacterium]
MNFAHRSYQQELLDKDDIPLEDIRRNMYELDVINTWLGGHAITLSGLQQLLTKGHSQPVSICEIGCGGGDNLFAIQQWCNKKGIPVSLTGIDINPFCIEVAQKRLLSPGTRLIVADYRSVQFDQKPAIIFSSLFCHHFTNEELADQLRWMKANAGNGFFINDLHRHVLAYYSIKWITGAFSKSYLVKNDAPLSVARGFSKKEWQELLYKAGITNFSLRWKWAFRWLITVPSI